MTTPVEHGYPDWGRQLSASDILITDNVNVAIAAATTYGPFFVGNTPFLQVQGAGFTTPVTYQIDWANDAAMAAIVGRDVLMGDTTDIINQTIPVRAAYVQFIASLTAYPNNHTLQVATQRERSNQIISPGGTNVLLVADAVAVGAGATLVLNTSSVRGGRIYWQVGFEFGVSWIAGLFAVNNAGTQLILDVMGSGFSKQGRIIFAPAMPLRMSITNRDGVARNCYATALFHPFEH